MDDNKTECCNNDPVAYASARHDHRRWADLNIEERVSRLRVEALKQRAAVERKSQQILRLQDDIQVLRLRVARLEGHEHGKDGKPVMAFADLDSPQISDFGIAAMDAKLDALADQISDPLK